jgi:hypothetical protein
VGLALGGALLHICGPCLELCSIWLALALLGFLCLLHSAPRTYCARRFAPALPSLRTSASLILFDVTPLLRRCAMFTAFTYCSLHYSLRSYVAITPLLRRCATYIRCAHICLARRCAPITLSVLSLLRCAHTLYCWSCCALLMLLATSLRSSAVCLSRSAQYSCCLFAALISYHSYLASLCVIATLEHSLISSLRSSSCSCSRYVVPVSLARLMRCPRCARITH